MKIYMIYDNELEKYWSYGITSAWCSRLAAINTIKQALYKYDMKFGEDERYDLVEVILEHPSFYHADDSLSEQ